jgi:hypothetical protein
MAGWLQSLAALLLAAGALGARASQAGEPLVIPPAESVASARQAVRTAISTARSRFPGDTATSELLASMQQKLSAGDISVDDAASALSSLADGRGFLALPEFVKLRDKLRAYTAMLRATSEPDLAARYAEHVAALEQAIASDVAADAAEPYRWLAERELARQLRNAAAQRFAQNNVVLRVSAASGNRILPNPFTQSFRQTTTMEGTPARVTGTLVARSQLYAPPGGQRMDHAGINVNAVIRTQVGMNRERMSITASGTTNLFAQVLLEVRDNDFHIAGSTLTSRTSMNLGNVSTGRCLGNHLVNRLAGRVFDRKRGEINAQADQQIVAQGKPMMLAEVASIVGQINTGKNEVIAPIVAYGLTPQLGISSDSGGLNMMFRVATPLQLAAHVPPPPPVAGTGSFLAVHESAANNAGDMFAGLTIDEQRFRETVFDSLGFTPVEPEAPGGEVPHTLTFSRQTPLTAQFFSERIKVRLQIDGLSDGQEKTAFENPVTADVVYRFDSQAQGVVLVREAMECHVEEPQKSKYEATISRFLVPLARQDDVTTLGQLLSIVQLKADKPTAVEGWLQMPLVER